MSIDQQAQALGDTSTTDAPVTDAPATERTSDHARPEGERVFKATRPEEGAKKERVRASSMKPLHDQVKDTPAGAPAADPAKPWEGPGYTKRWKEEARKAAQALATNPQLEAHWKALQPELDGAYSYIGQRDQQMAQIRQRFEPLNDMLTPFEQNWKMQGMSLQQGLQQTLAYQQALTNDVDAALPQLATLLPKPRDAAKVLQALSQAWGADLGQVAQGQPYLDPQVQQMVTPLVQELNALKQATFQQQQHAQQQFQQHVLSQVDAFENAVDAKGKKLHPYFRDAFPDMLTLVQMGRARTVNEAYELATRYLPQAVEDRAKEAGKQALANASRSNDAAKQASDASRNVSGSKANGQAGPARTRLEAMQMADRGEGVG